MPADLSAILADLHAEGDDLDALVAGIPARSWAAPTPAEGWSIAYQIAHLAWTDAQALLAAADPGAFAARLKEFAAIGPGFVDQAAAEGAALPPAALLAHWRESRTRLAAALAAYPGDGKLPWFGPPMRPASMASARLMETWAHGQDVADALGVRREPTARLRPIVHIGVRTFGFSFAIRGLPSPAGELRVELRAPDGSLWEQGPPDAADRVTGSAEDFCLLVTRRRHPADLGLTVTGEDAGRWAGIAQAFAGAPGPERPARTG
ncbi:TIGR03084 family metal-binding protein [Yinghuangia soli]|uniref:TIGR03084 family metal-binding protein n=1 Tax=Yinghuangia soli TaxID=2908204 RepID=A0AA41U004_9ACTN|nr:TIGR03084 family metal-binding protein [Yinghuangia soli]MCF2525917.1 TIGR03084 family metal-binding protein [Yinghuangia soli]